MSELDDDIARGCLKNGEPLEAKWGSGWWSGQPEQEQPPTDMDIWNDLQRQNDELKAENERLREVLKTDVSIQELCYAYHVMLRKADVFDDIHQFINNLNDQKYHDAMKLLLDVRKLILTEVINEVTK